MLLLANSASALTVTGAGVATQAKLLPFENKDAYFSCPPRYFGVFDGVSAMTQSRAYAQTLAKVTCSTLSTTSDDDWTEQAQNALLQAGRAARDISGGSTLAVVRLDLDAEVPCVRVFTVGDCECMVLRSPTPGSIELVSVSTIKVHDNGAPYQLAGKGWITDMPEDGIVAATDVQAGDTILLYSDGLSNNLENEEIAKIVGSYATSPVDVVADTLVQSARAAGWVDDDVTCVMMRLGEGPAIGGEPVFADTAPWENIKLPAFKLPFT